MNSIYELEAQNLHDSWSILYFNMANALTKNRADGEARLRETVRMYGEKIGKAEAAEHKKIGEKINLENFFCLPRRRFYDPRLFVERQRLNEQVALLNVIRSPFAQRARLCESEGVAKIFCEEFLSACIGAYTGNIAQVNISELLEEVTNNHGRIAVYFRPGNVGTHNYAKHFSQFTEQKSASKRVEQSLESAKDIWNYSALELLNVFSSDESVCDCIGTAAISAAVGLGEFLTQRAKSMERELNARFIDENCAFPAANKALPPFGKRLSSALFQTLGLEGGTR